MLKRISTRYRGLDLGGEVLTARAQAKANLPGSLDDYYVPRGYAVVLGLVGAGGGGDVVAGEILAGKLGFPEGLGCWACCLTISSCSFGLIPISRSI